MAKSPSRRRLRAVAASAPVPNIHAAPFGATSDRLITLSRPDREALASISVLRRLPAGTVLFEQGRPATHVYNVLAGCVYSERLLASGSRRGLALLLPGDLCGMASRGLYVNSGRTLTATEVLRIPVDELKAMLLRNPTLQMVLLCKMAHGIRETQRQILLLSRKDPVERLALLISTLRHASAGRPADVIAVPSKYKELASYLDLSPARLKRALDRLVADKVIAYARDTLRVTDPKKLQRLIDRPGGARDVTARITGPA